MPVAMLTLKPNRGIRPNTPTPPRRHDTENQREANTNQTTTPYARQRDAHILFSYSIGKGPHVCHNICMNAMRCEHKRASETRPRHILTAVKRCLQRQASVSACGGVWLCGWVFRLLLKHSPRNLSSARCWECVLCVLECVFLGVELSLSLVVLSFDRQGFELWVDRHFFLEIQIVLLLLNYLIFSKQIFFM